MNPIVAALLKQQGGQQIPGGMPQGGMPMPQGGMGGGMGMPMGQGMPQGMPQGGMDPQEMQRIMAMLQRGR